MKANAVEHDRRAERMDDLAALVRLKVAPEQRGALEAFVRAYYGQVDPDDLAERQPADLFGAALSHWNFARKRKPGQVRVRAFNPTIEEHGWQSTHTIIEIVNDDMPFLVDSVTMEVNRHGLALHLISHPIVDVTRAADGTLTGVAAHDAPGARRESFIHVEVDRIVGDEALEDAGRGRRAACWATCASPWTTGRRCGTRRSRLSPRSKSARRRSRVRSSTKAARSCSGWPTTTSRSWATGATISSP